MLKQKLRIGLLATALLAPLIVTTVSIGPATADPQTTISIKPINTKCTDKQDRVKWKGGEPQYSHLGNVQSRPRGSMYICWSLYKVREDRRKFDWWVAYLETRWYNADGPTQWTADAYMSQQIGSSQWAADNTESATGSFTSNRECGTPFSISAGFFGASVSTTQQLCDDYRVTRGVFDGNSALWETGKVGKVDRIETVFMQKVRHGSTRPKFKYWVEIPRYSYEHNGAIWIRNTKYKWIGRHI